MAIMKSVKDLYMVNVTYKGQKIGIFYFETQEQAKQFGTDCAMFAYCIENNAPDAEIEKHIGKYVQNDVYDRFFTAYANSIRLLNKKKEN